VHLRPSYNQVAGDLLERRALHRRHYQGSTGQTVDEMVLPRRRANKSQLSRCDIFPTGRVVSVLTRGPWQGSKWSSARPEAREGGAGRWERGREQKRGRELLEKRRGTSASLPGEGPGWQMRAGPTPYRTRRAVRVVTGPLNRMA
jgi:hypothetical protein